MRPLVLAVILLVAGAADAAARPGLQIGITEPNPAFLRPSPYEAFERWRPEMARLQPEHLRLVVEWDKAVAPDGSYDPVAPQGGCLRTLPPCAGWFGIRAQLQAAAAAQRVWPGHYRLLVVPTYTPAAHAAPASGCEKPGTTARSRAVADLGAYRQMLRAIQAEALRAGAEIPYWSPWNEPNHPYFLSPQRARCDPRAPSTAVDAYLRLARVMQEELAPGQSLVIGELAATTRTAARATRMVEFVRALPRDLVCGAPVFGVHKYMQQDPVDALARELTAFGCHRTPRIWITETGAKTTRHSLDGACRSDRSNLQRWYRDPRVDAAFHYTLREDDRFPTGLITTYLDGAYPALAEWQAWGARPHPASPPAESSCRPAPAGRIRVRDDRRRALGSATPLRRPR